MLSGLIRVHSHLLSSLLCCLDVLYGDNGQLLCNYTSVATLEYFERVTTPEKLILG